MDRLSFNKFFSKNKKLYEIQEENYGLKFLNNQLKTKNKELNWQFKNLKSTLNTLNDNNKKLSEDISNLINDAENLNNQIHVITEENNNLIDEIGFLKRKMESLNRKNKYSDTFINFQEFLSKSYISPIVEVPFLYEDKRVLAFMDHLGKYLRNNVSNSDYNPLVSIIMSICNHEDIVHKAIKSVLYQTYTNFELIIIDDGSNDETSSLLELIDDERVFILHSDKRDYSYSRNVGLNNINGDIVMYLDSDNQWDSTYVQTMVGAFIELSDADALYSGQYLFKNFDSKPYAFCFAAYNKPLLHNHNYINLNSFCHKSNILNKINGFDEDLNGLFDWDFILKISNNFKIYSIPIILSKFYNYDYNEMFFKENLNYYEISKTILSRNKIPLKKYPPLNKRVSIIIPNYESLNELKMCIESILTSDSNLLDIIVVDNNSSEDVKKYLTGLQSKGKIKLILNNINYGFSFAINQGINISCDDSDILILNNDTILTEGSIEHMQFCAYSIPKCGLVVPHEMLFEGDNRISYNVPYADNNFECDVTPSILHHNIINMPIFHDGNLLELNFAPFFCTYIKREVYEKTLGLDPELGRHYRSDRIFSDFIRHFLKLKIYQAPNAFVYHRHQVATSSLMSTKKEEYEYMYNKNQWESNLAKDLGFKKPIWDN